MSRRSLLVPLTLLFLAAALQAQPRHIIVGKEPSFLFTDPTAGRVHVLTLGVDANFDGVFEADSGDVSAAWYVIDPVTERVVDSAVFHGFFNNFPVRPAVDLQAHTLYMPLMGRVRAFNINTLQPLRDTVIDGFFSGVSLDSAGPRLVLAERVGFTDPGFAWVFDPATGDTLARVRSGINPNMSVALHDLHDRVHYVTINEGGFGAKNASLSAVTLQPNIYEKVNDSAMGGGGSDIAERAGRIYVALGGGHRVYVIDESTGKDLPFSPISFGPIGQNGPRTLAFDGDSVLLVGTYSAQLVRIRTATGAVMDTIAMRGKVESIAVRDSIAFVAISQSNSGGGADSVMQVVNLRTKTILSTVTLRRQPLALVNGSNGTLHAFCMGDSTAHWWLTLDASTLAVVAARPFSGVITSPFRVVYDPLLSDTAYAIVNDTLRAMHADSNTIDSRVLYTPERRTGHMVMVSDGGEYLLLSETEGSGNFPEYLHVLGRDGSLVARFKTGARPFGAVRVPQTNPGDVVLYVLGRGKTSAQHSLLDYFAFQQNALGTDSLGGGANHIVLVGQQALVTMNGTHEVVLVNLATGAVEGRVPTGTTGADGPRESLMLSGGRLVTTTYGGDVIVANQFGTTSRYPIGGKGEGITSIGSKVFIARFSAPDYSPDSVVVVFDADSLVASVDHERSPLATMTLEQNVPNPAPAQTTIGFGIERSQPVVLALYTTNGQLVARLMDRELEAGSYSVVVNTALLPSGAYLYSLEANGRRITRTMQVVR
ncbi:MAG: T9SS type A sorting domain-containing protein [Bacteroidetes bacterium]|nr:T9SS type A sorting domain-containing protein [Bacteroidota bacterium]